MFLSLYSFGEFNKIKLGAAQQYTVVSVLAPFHVFLAENLTELVFRQAGRPDPPKERLARLQLEVQALLSEVEAAKGSMGDGANDAKESAAIATQVGILALRVFEHCCDEFLTTHAGRR